MLCISGHPSHISRHKHLGPFCIDRLAQKANQQKQGWLHRQTSGLQASTSGRATLSSRTEHMLPGMRFCISDDRPRLQPQRQTRGLTPSILCKQGSIDRRVKARYASTEHCGMQRSAACKADSLRNGSAGTAGRNQTGPCKAGSSGFLNTAVTAAGAQRSRQSSCASAGRMSSSQCLHHYPEDEAPASANAHGESSQGFLGSTAMALPKRTAAAFPRFQRGQGALSRAGLHRKGHVEKDLARQGCYSQSYCKQGHAGEDAMAESQAEWYEFAEGFERMLVPAGEQMCCSCTNV